MRRYLLVPAGGKGDGLGHVSRCVKLAHRLNGDVSLYTGSLSPEAAQRVRNTSGVTVVDHVTPRDEWDVIVLDRRRTSVHELRDFEKHGTVVCLDEGGRRGSMHPILSTLFHVFRGQSRRTFARWDSWIFPRGSSIGRRAP